MIEIKNGNKTIYFTHQADADNYNDYLKNGLKVIRKDNRVYYFNNGDRLINVSMQGEKVQRYVLHQDNRTITSKVTKETYSGNSTIKEIFKSKYTCYHNKLIFH